MHYSFVQMHGRQGTPAQRESQQSMHIVAAWGPASYRAEYNTSVTKNYSTYWTPTGPYDADELLFGQKGLSPVGWPGGVLEYT